MSSRRTIDDFFSEAREKEQRMMQLFENVAPNAPLMDPHRIVKIAIDCTDTRIVPAVDAPPFIRCVDLFIVSNDYIDGFPRGTFRDVSARTEQVHRFNAYSVLKRIPIEAPDLQTAHQELLEQYKQSLGPPEWFGFKLEWIIRLEYVAKYQHDDLSREVRLPFSQSDTLFSTIHDMITSTKIPGINVPLPGINVPLPEITQHSFQVIPHKQPSRYIVKDIWKLICTMACEMEWVEYLQGYLPPSVRLRKTIAEIGLAELEIMYNRNMISVRWYALSEEEKAEHQRWTKRTNIICPLQNTIGYIAPPSQHRRDATKYKRLLHGNDWYPFSEYLHGAPELRAEFIQPHGISLSNKNKYVQYLPLEGGLQLQLNGKTIPQDRYIHTVEARAKVIAHGISAPKDDTKPFIVRTMHHAAIPSIIFTQQVPRPILIP